MNPAAVPPPYYLGGPMWGNRACIGSLFPPKVRGEDMLALYASVLTSVEGNQTFYGVPPVGTFLAWRDRVPARFRFCFKFPREVSHAGSLARPAAASITADFLDRVAAIADRLGVLSLQLPPRFHGGRIDELAAFLAALPPGLTYAVEPRHPDWFDGGDHERRLDDLLRSRGVNRVLFNTSVVHALPADSDAVRIAQGKKPRIPDRFTATAGSPFLRYAGAPDAEANDAPLQPAVDAVAGWIRSGLTPFVFFHTPGDRQVPHLCRRFHERLPAALPDRSLPPMPPWPGERTTPPLTQLSLFDE